MYRFVRSTENCGCLRFNDSAKPEREYQNLLARYDERRLRELALAWAQKLKPPYVVFAELGFNPDDYIPITRSIAFNRMVAEAAEEWRAAASAATRVKLKAAAHVEDALPSFHAAMIGRDNPLSSRVRALEAVARIGGLNDPPPAQPAGQGQYFKLEIHLDGREKPIVVGGDA
jgi:hypothetical protein